MESRKKPLITLPKWLPPLKCNIALHDRKHPHSSGCFCLSCRSEDEVCCHEYHRVTGETLYSYCCCLEQGSWGGVVFTTSRLFVSLSTFVWPCSGQAAVPKIMSLIFIFSDGLTCLLRLPFNIFPPYNRTGRQICSFPLFSQRFGKLWNFCRSGAEGLFALKR